MESRKPNNKRPIGEISGGYVRDKVYKFKILLPNGISLGMTVEEPKEPEMALQEFIRAVQLEYFQIMRQSKSPRKPKREIMWKSGDLYLEDAFGNKIGSRINFRNFKPHKCHILTLHDGSGATADTFENMWDLTPDTDLLAELPEEYTYESALADLIDNSLQAVWSNGINERRLISVEIEEGRISIFDTGPGMDGSDENSIVKWGKMGSSLHRSSRGQAIGGNPPYLVPFFGMFGYGGPIASMHLGRHALVSSKTKESKKVYTLHLKREALLSSSGSEQTWKTDGGIRDPLEDEIQISPQGSFTQVEIRKLKMKSLDIVQLQCKLKDIYFPYIQCDEVSNTGKTMTPIEFQVNRIDLAEIEGGEVATTNLHSCNGPDFILQLHFNQDNVATNSQGLRACKEANARLKCVYFPVVKGKENIKRILEILEAEGCGIEESYETFSRVSIRRLGRLLPDARWAWLPFMELRQKKGDKAQILKRCCLRVKCFIETDAGFNPTPSKTDLAHHHSFTTALKNFGIKPSDKDKDINVDIYRDGKQLTLLQLEREYQDWILNMHDSYDEEIDRGDDQPVIVVSPNKKSLKISSDVARIHQEINRKGTSWKSGQKIKVLKGACPGVHKNNVFATLEYILLEGFQGDAGGEARLICRPLGVPEENGCVLTVTNGNANLDIRASLSLPISVIDSAKCQAVDTPEWNYQLERQLQKAPSTIDILNRNDCQELGIDGALPDSLVYAGRVPPPKDIVAVVRPACFISSRGSKNLDQKYIVRDVLEMSMQIERFADAEGLRGQHIYSGRIQPSSRKGFHGLFIFPLGSKFPDIFQKAGSYTFSFSIRGSSVKKEKRVLVEASSRVGRWGLLSDERSPQYKIRVGTCLPPFSIACYDIYDNHIPFTYKPEVMVKLNSNCGMLCHVDKIEVELSPNKLNLTVKDALIECTELDNIWPSYDATLVICSRDELFSVSVPCQVSPGSLKDVKAQPQNFMDRLHPGHVIMELVLEMFDAYGNHVQKGLEVLLNVDGFIFQDQIGSKRKATDHGCVDLSGILKVTAGYGENVSLSVISDNKVVFKKTYQTEKKELRIASGVPEFCVAGSQLENIVFEVVNSNGDVDETIHDGEKYGQSHTLTIKEAALDTDNSVQYTFRHGRCRVPSISLPQKQGEFCFVAAHCHHPEIHLTVKVFVVKTPKLEHDYSGPHCSDEKIMLLPEASASKHVENFNKSFTTDEKELLNDVRKFGLSIGNCEMALKELNDQMALIEQETSLLKASLGLESSTHLDYNFAKEAMIKQIGSKCDSAAAVFCSLERKIPFQEAQIPFKDDIVGLVAVLGTVKSSKLSRILAEYLGDDQMLAVVCRSYAAACALEKYKENGDVDHERALYAVAAVLGKSITGRFLIICLDNIRPYTGDFIASDPQRKLKLPSPTSLTGDIPLGFLDYAVNMIDIHQLCIMTSAGHGLRDTLFYRLFGELQVYETREHLTQALPYIKHGAVSLDGGIARGNGVISLGHCEPKICFPVVTLESQIQPSPDRMKILKQIEEKEKELRETCAEIDKVTKIWAKYHKKFNKLKDQYYNKFLDQEESLKEGYLLEYRTNMN